MESTTSRFERATLRRASTTILPDFHADPDSGRPLYAQIVDFVREAIRSGRLPRGARLPSTRALAMTLSISRNTVLTAYETLAAEGLLSGTIGSGTRVAGTPVRPKMRDLRFLLSESHYPATSGATYRPVRKRDLHPPLIG